MKHKLSKRSIYFEEEIGHKYTHNTYTYIHTHIYIGPVINEPRIPCTSDRTSLCQSLAFIKCSLQVLCGTGARNVSVGDCGEQAQAWYDEDIINQEVLQSFEDMYTR